MTLRKGSSEAQCRLPHEPACKASGQHCYPASIQIYVPKAQPPRVSKNENFMALAARKCGEDRPLHDTNVVSSEIGPIEQIVIAKLGSIEVRNHDQAKAPRAQYSIMMIENGREVVEVLNEPKTRYDVEQRIRSKGSDVFDDEIRVSDPGGLHVLSVERGTWAEIDPAGLKSNQPAKRR
jgi:hypothetical protein